MKIKGKKLIEQGFKHRYQWVDELVTDLNAQERNKVVEALIILTEKAKEVEA